MMDTDQAKNEIEGNEIEGIAERNNQGDIQSDSQSYTPRDDVKLNIQFNHVTKSFKNKTVLSDVDLQIHSGERIVLLGANGAGKTTLIRCLLGEYVYKGQVLISGKSPRLHRHELLQYIGFVPQLPPPLKMPVGALIQFASSVCGSNQGDIIRVAHQLGLDIEKHWNQPFVKLSGGQKQKILISIALGRRVRILCLDEPTANLDPAARKILLELLSQMDPSTILLISSHRTSEVANLVHRAIELDQGKIISDKIMDKRRENEFSA